MRIDASLTPTLLNLNWTAGDGFALVELARLARRLPTQAVEVGVPAANGYFSTTTGSLAAARLDEAFAGLHSTATWIVLKDVQQDAAYDARIGRLFESLLTRLEVDPAAAVNRRCHIFISSHGARTPLHADDCNGLLVQVSGQKEMVMYDMGDGYFSPRLARRAANASRVFPLPAGHAYQEKRFTLDPGSSLTVPWNWPHEGATPAGSESVSLNVSFETARTAQFAMAAVTNDLLLHLGRSPSAIGVDERLDAAKALLGSAISRTRILSRLERRKMGDKVVRAL